MKIRWGVLAITAVLLCGSVTAGVADESSPAHQGALRVAKAVDLLFRSARTTYATKVASKLKKEGTGSTFEFGSKKGFVPLPAQFAREVAFHVAVAQQKADDNQFGLVMRSLWNLNPNHNLKDDFEKAGWQFLARQQEDAQSQGQSLQRIKWKPFVREETIDGKRMLRYFSADPAAALSCVRCHNEWEKKSEIQTRRKAQGVEAGKTFRVHELMGALSITIPLSE